MNKPRKLASIEITGLPPGLKTVQPAVLKAVRAVLRQHGVKHYALSITFVGDRRMTRLNREALGRRGTTDVIAFDLSEQGLPAGTVGDIYVSLDRARHQSAAYGVSLREEVLRLAIHGVLHIVGYRDDTRTARRRMELRQERSIRGGGCGAAGKKSGVRRKTGMKRRAAVIK
jgi:probable rRNA maturation factor